MISQQLRLTHHQQNHLLHGQPSVNRQGTKLRRIRQRQRLQDQRRHRRMFRGLQRTQKISHLFFAEIRHTLQVRHQKLLRHRPMRAAVIDPARLRHKRIKGDFLRLEPVRQALIRPRVRLRVVEFQFQLVDQAFHRPLGIRLIPEQDLAPLQNLHPLRRHAGFPILCRRLPPRHCLMERLNPPRQLMIQRPIEERIPRPRHQPFQRCRPGLRVRKSLAEFQIRSHHRGRQQQGDQKCFHRATLLRAPCQGKQEEIPGRGVFGVVGTPKAGSLKQLNPRWTGWTQMMDSDEDGAAILVIRVHPVHLRLNSFTACNPDRIGRGRPCSEVGCGRDAHAP